MKRQGRNGRLDSGLDQARRARRPFVEQLEQRMLLTGIPADEVDELIKLGPAYIGLPQVAAVQSGAAGVVDALVAPAQARRSLFGSDLRGAIDEIAVARSAGWVPSQGSRFLHNGQGMTGSPLDVSASGAILAIAQFAPGDSAVVETMKARGLEIGRSFTKYGDAEVWVDASSETILAGIPGLLSVSLPIMGVTSTGTYLSESAGYGPLASNPSAGTLTVRTSDTAGQITIGNVNGITMSSLIDIYWAGGRRIGASVTNLSTVGSSTTVTFSGGAGSNLPAQSSFISIDTSLKVQRVLDQFSTSGVGGTAIDGSGFKIGVMSNGVFGLSGAQSSGNLPATVTVGNNTSPTLGEGTAMLEIVHDIAPGAALYFYGDATNFSNFQAGVTWMIGQGVDIIVDDIVFVGEPYFTDGPIAASVQTALNDGIVYVTSAGNQNFHHYQANASLCVTCYHNFNVGGTVDSTLDVLVKGNVNPSNLFRLQNVLQWSDDWANRTNSVSLELWNNTETQQLASFTSTNNVPLDVVTWYNGEAAPVRTGNTSIGSSTISNLSISTSDLVVGMVVGGAGIPTNATITSILSSTSIAISSNATLTNTGTVLTFGAASRSGSIVNASTTISGISTTSNLKVGMTIGGTGIPYGATIASIVNSTTITISNAATATGTTTLTFGVASTVKLKIRNSGLSSLSREVELNINGSSGNPNDFFQIFEPYQLSFSGDALIAQEALPGVIAVGAVNAGDLENNDAALYSSRGPSTIYTDFTTQTKIQRPSLGVTGIDQITTWVGNNGAPDIPAQFRGTSAAAPGIGGIAALMLEAAGGTSTRTADAKGAAARRGNTTIGSPTISNISLNTADLTVGMMVSGPGIPAFSRIATIVSPTSITISSPGSGATATGTGVALAFGALAATATDLTAQGGATGYDNVYGSGRANALDAVYRIFLPTAAILSGGDNGLFTNDRVTSNTALTFSGTAPPGSYVGLFISGTSVEVAATQLGPGVTSYNLNHTAPLNAQTTYNIRVKSSASASAWSWAPSTTVWVDALATTVPTTAPDLTSGSDTGQSNSDNLTTDNTPTFAGNVDSIAAGALVTLWIDGVLRGSQQLGAGLTAYSITSSSLAAGSHSAVIRAQKVASAPSSSFYPSPSLPFTVDDGTAPVATIVQCGTGASSRNGSIVQSSATVTNLSSTADLAPGMIISGSGIQAGTTIASIVSSTSIVMNTVATAGGVSTLSFGACPIPTSVLINFNKPVWRSPTDYSDLSLIRVDVGSVASVVSATQFSGDTSFANVDDYYNGRTLRFTSGPLNNQSGVVLDYVGATRTFIFNSGTFTGAPSVSNTFQIDSTVVSGSVSSTTSTTQFNGNSALAPFDDYYNGRLLKFTSGVLNGQSQPVRDYVGATRTFTFSTGFSTTPAVNDTFTLDNNRVLLSTSDTLDTSNFSSWTYSNFFDIQMSSGKYSFSVKAGNFFFSMAGNVPATASSAGVWTQTDGAYQNGGKSEGPSESPGVYYDVSGDGFISPLDAVLIANFINANGSQNLATWCPTHTCNPNYYDPNNDGWVTSSDFDTVIDWLDAGGNSQPPGFAAASVGESSTPPADLQATDVTANVKLVTTDLDGTPITSVKVGQQFQLRAFLVLAAPEGVQPLAGYADVQFSSLLVTPTASRADVGFASGSSVSRGLIDEAGQIMYGDASGLMFVKTFKATKKGTATFSADAADLFGNEIYVNGLGGPLPWSQVTFGSTTLQIKP